MSEKKSILVEHNGVNYEITGAWVGVYMELAEKSVFADFSHDEKEAERFFRACEAIAVNFGEIVQ